MTTANLSLSRLAPADSGTPGIPQDLFGSNHWIERREIGPCTLYLGDAPVVVPRMSGIDAVVTDPPYGIGYQRGGIGKGAQWCRTTAIHGDDKPFDPTWLLRCALGSSGTSIKKVHRVAIFGADRFASKLPDGGEGVWCCWDKSAGAGPNDSFADAEFWWQGVKTQRRVYRHFWKGLTRDKTGKDGSGNFRYHQSEKPVALMAHIIKALRVPVGSLVCDPYGQRQHGHCLHPHRAPLPRYRDRPRPLCHRLRPHRAGMGQAVDAHGAHLSGPADCAGGQGAGNPVPCPLSPVPCHDNFLT
jgi:site-specific DNA-methyltransferase (adenine-specific)